MDKTISLCITSYDQDYHLIPNLLNLFKNQSDTPDEIFIFCSGVSDFACDKVFSHLGKDIKIRKAISTNRVNQATARNIISKYVTKDICLFFDVDDIPHNQKIELTRKVMNENECDFMLHSYEMGDISLPTISRITRRNLYTDIRPVDNCTNVLVYVDDQPTTDKPIHHAHIAVKREIFNKVKYNISPDYYRREDGKFCQDLLTNGYSGIYLDKQLINYTS